jgi:uncharacterized protein
LSCTKRNNNIILDYNNDKFDGIYRRFYDNGKLAYEIDCRNSLPYTVIQSNDSCGNKLDPGTLKEGNGSLRCYYKNGNLKSVFNYKNQMISGKILHYYDSGKIKEEGFIFCNNDKSFKKTVSDMNIEDFNIFSAWQQNFSKGTDYKAHDQDGHLLYKTTSIFIDSIGTEGILFQRFEENGKLVYEGIRINGLETGIEKEYYNSGQIEKIGNYLIVDKDSGKESQKTGVFKYYYKNGFLKAEIMYSKNKEAGKSYYYDDSGNLKRTREIFETGEIINIFNGDTVNRTDANGLKQGKWISFPFYVSEDDCKDIPNQIKYYKDNYPIGAWEYYYNNGTIHEKYIWNDPAFAHYFRYNSDGNILEEGIIVNEEIKSGEWKEYDYKKGFLKFKGLYNQGKKDGIWQEFRKNGEIKNEIKYNNGKVESDKKII